MNQITVKTNKNHYIFKISKNIYPLPCIKKAASNFLEFAYIYIDEEENNYVVKISKHNDLNFEKDIVGEFYNELLRECIRFDISKETKNIRELIVGRSLYSTCIYDENIDANSTENMESNIINEEIYDINNIAKNWFEQ
mgnify:CR=1 FL=1